MPFLTLTFPILLGATFVLLFILHFSLFTALEARGYSDKLVEARNRPENNSSDKKSGSSSQPAVNRPTNPGHCRDTHEQRKSRAVRKSALPICITVSLGHSGYQRSRVIKFLGTWYNMALRE